MQPRPIADTSRLLFPSLRFCIISPSTFGTRLRCCVCPLFVANRGEHPIAFPSRLNCNSRFIFFREGFLKTWRFSHACLCIASASKSYFFSQIFQRYTMPLCPSGSKVAIKSFVFSTGLVAEKQQFCATRLSDFHELSRAAGPQGQLWQFWQFSRS